MFPTASDESQLSAGVARRCAVSSCGALTKEYPTVHYSTKTFFFPSLSAFGGLNKSDPYLGCRLVFYAPVHSQYLAYTERVHIWTNSGPLENLPAVQMQAEDPGISLILPSVPL